MFPLSFDPTSPAAGVADYLADPTIRLIADFFHAKGLEGLKREDREETWYQDWIDYQSSHGLYASLLSPKRYSSRGNQFSFLRLTRCAEALGYFSPAHGYSLQVSFLGLYPILLSDNEPLKQEAIVRLEAGGLFAFGVSEKAHGSDLFSNEFSVRAGAGGATADGSKYYIGNVNAASMVTILAKEIAVKPGAASRRAPFIFFALRPGEATAYQNVRKTRTLGVRAAFVGQFDVKGHPLPEGDIISRGRDAWEALHATVTLGKFLLGFGAVGICEHAFAEALDHLRQRVLYGKPVTDMPHIRATVAVGFARLMAMKLYAYRALDYLHAAGDDERRYLLFNAVQKARVSTEAVRVLALLSECMGARGFEAQTFFESALRDAEMIPGLEGSTHIDFGLTATFADNYFAAGDDSPAAPPSLIAPEADTGEGSCWMEARDRNAKTVRFAPYLDAFRPLRSLVNVRLFVAQVRAVHRFVRSGLPPATPLVDAGLQIALGKALATIAYGQLVAENCVRAEVAPGAIALIFHTLVEDLSDESQRLAAMFLPGSSQRALIIGAVRIPRTVAADFETLAGFIKARYAGPG